MHPFIRLLRYLKPYKSEYRSATFFSILNKLADIAPEILIGVAVDTVISQENSWIAKLGIVDVKMQLLALGLLTFLIWAAESLTEYAYSVKWRNLAQRTQHRLRLETYNHIQHLNISFFENKSTGSLLSILNDDVNQLERFLDDGINAIIQTLVATTTIGIVFFMLTPEVAIFAFFPIPFILFGAFFFQNRLAPLFLDVREKAGLISARLSNNLSGIFTIKSFTAEKYELSQVEKESEAYRISNRKAIALSSMVTPVIRIGVLTGFLITLIYGGFLTIEGELRVGAFSILVFLTQRLLWPLTRLAEITVLYQRSMASTKRILDLLNQPITDHRKGQVIKNTKGKISFDKVCFAYQDTPQIIHGIQLDIPAGSTAAFVGTTGSGKTTLIKLLLRLYEPSQGDIYLDDQNISDIDLTSLREKIGIVSQDVFLFHGTVFENIAYAQPHTKLDKVIKAAKMAEAHQFISELPQGYDTIIGERGQKLSGGQRQRLALARALLKDPPILILDEATSAVDNETEMAIQKSLKHIVVGRTTIMIAHRLSTIRNADQIYVLQKGKIIEHGTHDELLSKDKVYAALWKLQTGQDICEDILTS